METESIDWRKKPRLRGANSEWQEVFYLLYRQHHPKAFDQQHVSEAAEKLGLFLTNESVRVKLSRYVKDGVLEKPKMKSYKLTNKGVAYFNIQKSTLKELRTSNQEE